MRWWSASSPCPNCGTSSSGLVANSSDRILSVFSNPNHLGSFCALGLPLATVGFLRCQQKWPCLLCASLLLAASRGAWVATVCSLGLLIPAVGWPASPPQRVLLLRRGAILLSTWAITTVALQATPVLESSEGDALSVSERMQQTAGVLDPAERRQDSTLQHRLLLWTAAISMVRESPVLGVGPRGYASAYRQLLPELRAAPQFHKLSEGAQLDRPRFAHNEVLHVAAETGLLGWLALSGCLVVPLRAGIRAAARWLEQLSYQGRVATVIGALVHGCVSYPLHMPATAFPLFLVSCLDRQLRPLL